MGLSILIAEGGIGLPPSLKKRQVALQGLCFISPYISDFLQVNKRAEISVKNLSSPMIFFPPNADDLVPPLCRS